MKPLIVLIGVFAASLVVSKILKADWNLLFCGNLAMAAMLWFTSIAHFVFSKGMTMMMPDLIPFKKQLVYLTGFIEIAAGAGLLIPQSRRMTAFLLIVFFIAIFPANAHAAIKNIDYSKENTEGPGISYLWFRVPLQAFFIAWVWYFGIGT